MKPVYIDDDGAVQIYRDPCTGVAARWCPIHGDCTENPFAPDDERYSDHCSERDCPLHGETSTHGDSR